MEHTKSFLTELDALNFHLVENNRRPGKMTPKIHNPVKNPIVQSEFWKAIEYLKNKGGLTKTEFKKISSLICGVTKNKRGFAYRNKTGFYKFCVPYWAYKKQGSFKGRKIFRITHRLNSYFVYYIAHEISHVLNSPKARSHGHKFYKIFTRVCPIELQHYELGYKTKTASKYIKEAK
tara:strand:+ start:8 stop:538 length:531 start_codon:yes stop_codon:yes gene_type:complete